MEIVGSLVLEKGAPLLQIQIVRSPVAVFCQTSSLAVGVGMGLGARANRMGSNSPVMKLA